MLAINGKIKLLINSFIIIYSNMITSPFYKIVILYYIFENKSIDFPFYQEKGE